MQTITVVIVTMLLVLPNVSLAQLVGVATFSQKGVKGHITFVQETRSSPTLISVNLTGLPSNQAYPWHVHLYQFAGGTSSPCSLDSVGDHYDPLGAINSPTYSTDCNTNITKCKIGDLSGKFGRLNISRLPISNLSDPTLFLYGHYSIMGRSVVIHYQNDSRFVCANILSASSSQISNILEIQVAHFRQSTIFGNIYLTEYGFNSTVVSVNLTSPNSTQGHNWHVHEEPVTGTDCATAGAHYDPLGLSMLSNYSSMCNPMTPYRCEIGDLSGKGEQISFISGRARLQYTDVQLPIVPDLNGYSVRDRSIVIHAQNGGGTRLDCANLTHLRPREVIATFTGLEGIYGHIKFVQNSLYELTEVTVNISGLNGQAGGYHVHQTPVGEGVSGRQKCAHQYTGGHWNPRNVPFVISSNLTSDQYEIGDLSGKFGSLNGLHFLNDVYTDPNIPLFGVDSIIGRSIVIHDSVGERWACANIEYATPIIRASAQFTINGHTVQVRYMQPANDPYADTVIYVTNITAVSISPTATTTSFVSTTPVITSLMSFSSSESTTPSLSPALSLSPSLFSPSPSLSASIFTPSLIPSLLSPSPSPSSSSIFTPSLIPSSLSSPSLFSPSPSQSTATPFIDDVISMVPSSDSLLQPLPTVGSGSITMLRRKRDADEDNDEYLDDAWADEENMEEVEDSIIVIDKRQSSVSALVEWSVVDIPLNQQLQQQINCNSLSAALLSPNENMALCMSGHQLACSGGDLQSKHGPLTFGPNGIRVVFTDLYLPLSGPNSIVNKLLLIQTPDNRRQIAQIQVDSSLVSMASIDSIMCTTAMSTSFQTPLATETPTGGLPISQTTLIIICASGGGFLLILFLLIITIIIVCCFRRKRKDSRYKYMIRDNMKNHTSAMEMGKFKKHNPVFGTSYRVLYDYKPQQTDDLKLKEGDVVTLIEAPAGGDWWRGKVDENEGWFPKSYVEYIDMEAEDKKRKEDSFATAAATIRVASMAFTNSNLTPTMTRKAADSTPVTVPKLNNIAESAFIVSTSNQATPSSTPGLVRSSTPLLDDRVLTPITTPSPPPISDSPLPREDIYVAKYDYRPQGESELQLFTGDRVVVIERAEGGWWHGVIGNDHGWFPETFVESLESNEKQKEEKPQEIEEEPFRPRGMTEFNKNTSGSEEVEATEYRAVYTYNSETVGDLVFNEGDTILVYWANPNGWWFGAAGSNQGYFPGSYVEAVMDSPVPPPIVEEEEETVFRVSESVSPAPSGGSLSDDIAAAFKKRHQLSHSTDQLIKEPSPVPSIEGGGSLSDEIAAVLKKRQSREPSNERLVGRESPTPSTASLSDEIAAAFRKRKEDKMNDEPKTESVGNLESEIMNMLGSFGEEKQTPTEETQIQNKETVPDTTEETKKARRKAPPPPAAAARSKTKSPPQLSPSPKPSSSPKTPVSPEPSFSSLEPTPLPKPPSPKPPVSPEPSHESPSLTHTTQDTPVPPLTDATPLKETTPTSEDTMANKPPRVVMTLKGSPSSAKKRRAPPAPPSSLATHTQTAVAGIDNNQSKALSNPAAVQDSPVTERQTKQDVCQQQNPQNRPLVKNTSGGWKPQTKKSKLSAPRRAPPAPPAAPVENDTLKKKPKVKMVKRPVKRNIPPPPSIPLPPPPTRTIPPEPKHPPPPRPLSITNISHSERVNDSAEENVIELEEQVVLPPTRPKRDASLNEPNDYEKPTLVSNVPPAVDTEPLPAVQNDTVPVVVSNVLPAVDNKVPAVDTPTVQNDTVPVAVQNDTVPVAIDNVPKDDVPTDENKTEKKLPPTKPPPPLIKLSSSETNKEPSSSEQKTSETKESEETNATAPNTSKDSKLKPKVKPKPKHIIVKKSQQNMLTTPTANNPTKDTPKNETVVPQVKKRVPKPLPPTRVSSLPSTPTGSPSPSPSLLPRGTFSPTNLAEVSNDSKQKESSPTSPKSPISPITPTDPKSPQNKAPPSRPKAPPRSKSNLVAETTENKTEDGVINKIEPPVPKQRRRSQETSALKNIPARPPPPRRSSKQQDDAPPKYFKAIKSYVAEPGSAQLSLSEGDTLVILDLQPNEEGLTRGMLDDGSTGLFPLSHVQEFEPLPHSPQ